MVVRGIKGWVDYIGTRLQLEMQVQPWGERYLIPEESGGGWMETIESDGYWSVWLSDLTIREGLVVDYVQDDPFYIGFADRQGNFPGKARDATYPNNEVVNVHIESGTTMRAVGVYCFAPFFERLTKRDVMGFVASIQSYDDEALMKQITPILKQIREYTGEGLARRVFTESKVLELSAVLIRITEEEHKNDKITLSAFDSGQLHKVLDILAANMIDPPGLGELARMVTLNEYKMKVGFRQLFGTTIYEYLRLIRMEYAAKLLEDSRISAAEAGRRVGYQTPHGFANAFRKYYGKTPGQWQEERTV